MDRLNRNRPEDGRPSRQVLQVSEELFVPVSSLGLFPHFNSWNLPLLLQRRLKVFWDVLKKDSLFGLFSLGSGRVRPHFASHFDQILDRRFWRRSLVVSVLDCPGWLLLRTSQQHLKTVSKQEFTGSRVIRPNLELTACICHLLGPTARLLFLHKWFQSLLSPVWTQRSRVWSGKPGI